MLVSRVLRRGLFSSYSSSISIASNYRSLSSTTAAAAASPSSAPAPTVKITFFESKKGDKITVDAEVGKSVLDAALKHQIDIEGACGGEMACSTCHVILSKKLYDSLPKKSEEEQDMLDLAWGLQPT